jgi:hypothetical protein
MIILSSYRRIIAPGGRIIAPGGRILVSGENDRRRQPGEFGKTT